MQALSRTLATARGGGGGGRAAAQDDLHDLLPPSASAATPGTTLAQSQQAEEPVMSAGTDTPGQAAAHLRSYAAAGSDDIANANKPKLRNISGVWKVAGKTAAGRAVTEHVRLSHAQPGEQLTGGHVLYPGGGAGATDPLDAFEIHDGYVTVSDRGGNGGRGAGNARI